MEIGVQIIEGTFYYWLINNFNNITDITYHRYYDWFFTTPTMLLTLIIYLIYLREVEENPNPKVLNFFDVIEENKDLIIKIILLNELMLFLGYLGETKRINMKKASLLGFIPFLIYFNLIYENYAKYSKKGMLIFEYFISIWFLYGVASFMNYENKNISFNILDLFSKNFFGIYLFYLIYDKKIN
jgi:bacteriorhodopsin